MYTIPCDHAGGTFWYHPHHHGSTALQMGGGAMGALIIEDRQDIHGIPDQYFDMPELVLTIQVGWVVLRMWYVAVPCASQFCSINSNLDGWGARRCLLVHAVCLFSGAPRPVSFGLFLCVSARSKHYMFNI